MSTGNLPEATERHLQLRGLQHCVEILGQGPPVLLAHGMWCDAGMFAELAALLAPVARVLVPDFRGHGRSEVPATSWRIADLADDLVAMLDALKVQKVVLVGFSMGGMAAADFAIRYPERTAGLLLVGTSAAAEEPFRKLEINALARLIQLTGPPRFLPQEASRATFSPAFRKGHRREITRWESVVRSMPPAALIQSLRAVAGRPNLLPKLVEIPARVTIAVGGSDRVVRPRWSEAMHRALPGSRLEFFKGAGHALPMERPKEVARLVRDLLPALRGG